MKNIVLALLLAYSSCTLGETVIPVELQYGNPIATAVINGQEIRLIIDSGGSSLGLRPGIVAKINVIRLSEKTSTTDIHGMTRESNSFTIPSFVIGGHEFSDLSAYEWQMPSPLAKRTPAIGGTLGRDFLNKFIAVYNYSDLAITLYDNDALSTSKCTGVEIPLIEHPEGIIVTEVEVDHGIVRAIWDTGATHSFVKAHVAEEREFLLDPGEDTTGFYNSEVLSVGGSDFGPLDFVALPFAEPQNIDVFIGRNFFASHVVCINAVGGWLRVRPNQ